MQVWLAPVPIHSFVGAIANREANGNRDVVHSWLQTWTWVQLGPHEKKKKKKKKKILNLFYHAFMYSLITSTTEVYLPLHSYVIWHPVRSKPLVPHGWLKGTIIQA